VTQQDLESVAEVPIEEAMAYLELLERERRRLLRQARFSAPRSGRSATRRPPSAAQRARPVRTRQRRKPSRSW